MADPDPTPTPAPTPAPDPAPAPTPDPKPDDPKSYTQADLDKMFQDRVARERAKFADYDDLKSKAAKLDELEAANKTELEQATEARVKAETEGKAAIERANARLIQAEVLSAATTAKALKPEHLHRLIDLDGVTVGDDGQVTGADEAVKTFLDANPEYVGTGTSNGGADLGARTGGVKQVTRDQLKSMSPEAIVKARREGRTAALEGRT